MLHFVGCICIGRNFLGILVCSMVHDEHLRLCAVGRIGSLKWSMSQDDAHPITPTARLFSIAWPISSDVSEIKEL